MPTGSEKLNNYASPLVQKTPGIELPSLQPGVHNAIGDLASASLGFYQKDPIFRSATNRFQGPLNYMDGSTYSGQFKDGLRHGKGECVYIDGSCYQGEWKDGVRSGEGVFAFADGEIFVGKFQHDVAMGPGTFYYQDGSKYVGNFERNMMEG